MREQRLAEGGETPAKALHMYHPMSRCTPADELAVAWQVPTGIPVCSALARAVAAPELPRHAKCTRRTPLTRRVAAPAHPWLFQFDMIG